MVPLFIYSRIADRFVMPAQAGMTNKKSVIPCLIAGVILRTNIQIRSSGSRPRCLCISRITSFSEVAVLSRKQNTLAMTHTVK